jgi:hypothetical protein
MVANSSLRIGFIVYLLCAYSAYAEDLRRLELKIRDFSISVEVADTPSARQRGLMYRNHLPPDQGMIFIFPGAAYHGMWMVNTHIPLSAAFIDGRGIILNMADMNPLTTENHSPVGPVKYVLEMNQGWFAARGIKAGDEIIGLSSNPVAK